MNQSGPAGSVRWGTLVDRLLWFGSGVLVGGLVLDAVREGPRDDPGSTEGRGPGPSASPGGRAAAVTGAPPAPGRAGDTPAPSAGGPDPAPVTPPAVGAGDDLVGGPVPWPPEVLDDVGPEAVAAALARAPEACGEAGRHFVDVDCSEYPCVAVFRLPFPSPVVLGSQQALCTVPAWTFGQVRGISPPGGEGSALVLVPLVGGSEAAAEGVAALRLAARLELLSQAFRWVHTEGAAP